MRASLNEDGLDLLFREARSYGAWRDEAVGDDLLRAVYDLAKMGPTGSNCCPARIVFVRSPEAKERLRPCLGKGNVDKTMAAPATAIIGFDTRFHEDMSRLWPHGDGGARLRENPEMALQMGRFNATLQAAYFMLAARALGLDCGPLGGFDPEMVDEAFFPDGRVKSILLCNLGHGDPERLRPRGPRLGFDEACEFL